MARDQQEDTDAKAATSGKDAATESDLSRQRQMEMLAEQRQEENTIPLEESTTTTTKRGRGRAKGTGRGRKKKSKTGGGGGDEGYARASGLAKVREQAKCGSCGNPMTMSKNINMQPIPGVKLAKDKETGKYKNRSPGADEGKVTAVLCDDCVDRAQNPTYNKTDGTTSIDIKTGLIEREEDGKLINVPIENLKNY